MYLQGVVGLSPTQAGSSLVAFMLAMNACAGLAGQVLGRVHRYKRLPIVGVAISIAAVVSLAWHADTMTTLAFELTLFVIGAGFGPVPSLTAVAMQNVVARHQLGISVGTMNFSRNLYATMLIAVFGAIVLTGAAPGGGLLRDAVTTGMAQPAEAFRRVFIAAAVSMTVALAAIIALEEKPLQTGAEIDAQ